MFVTNGTEKSRNGQLLLTVDVGIHNVVDVGGKFNPRTLERNDTGGIKNFSVGVNSLTEENAR